MGTLCSRPASLQDSQFGRSAGNIRCVCHRCGEQYHQLGENIFQCSILVDQAYVVTFGSIQYTYVLNLTATTREVMATQTVADHWNRDHPLMQER